MNQKAMVTVNNVISKNDLIGVVEQALYSGELAVFAGAGLSVAAGYSDWEALMKNPAAELHLDIKREKHDLVSLAQFYCNTKKRVSINDLLSRSFPTHLKPQENHNILAKLPIMTYWTTNYDSLIEDALKANDKRVSVRKNDKDLQLSCSNYDAIVYKMHGDIQSPAEAVITRDDYEEYGINTRRLFRGVLEGMLLTKTFLFLGFGFNDPNFNSVLAKMRVLLGDDSRAHYYILKRISKPNKSDYEPTEQYTADEAYEYDTIKQNLQIADLDRYGIKIYLIDNYEDLTEILRIVLNRYKRRTVFISGSAEEFAPLGKDVAMDFIRKLSFELVKNGYRIVNGYGFGIGTSLINGVAEYCYDNKQKIEDRLRLMPFPLSAITQESLRKTWKKYREEMISQCGIAIYMFGNKKNETGVNADGVKMEYDIAKAHNLVNIPLAFTGHMAKKIYSEEDYDAQNILTENEKKNIAEFHDIDTNVGEIIKILNRIRNRDLAEV